MKVDVTDAGPIVAFNLTITYDFAILGTPAGVLDAVGAFLDGGLFDLSDPSLGWAEQDLLPTPYASLNSLVRNVQGGMRSDRLNSPGISGSPWRMW